MRCNQLKNRIQKELQISPMLRYLEIMHTKAKVVVCKKLNLKTGSLQTCHFLPLCKLDDFFRYEMNITIFFALSKSVVIADKCNSYPRV